ncbi:MAG: insulinase family protein [Thermoanaerobaculia bacterium]|nr:MAG: insulinase family protein [Thermoanaerobaculia bacterium]
MRAIALAGALACAAVPAAAIETWTLEDGTAVALVEDRRVPLVTIRLAFPAGTWSPWVRERHAREAFELQARDSRAALRARIQALAVELDLAMDERSANLTATFLREDFDGALRLIGDVLANRDLDRRELVARGRARRLEWELARRDPRFRLAQETAWRLFDPGDPRRWSWEPPPRVETSARRLAAARDVLVRLPGRAVGFAGDLSRAEAESAARALLPPASTPAPGNVAPELAAVRAHAGGDAEVPVRRLTQVYFALARPSLPWTDRDDPAFLIADHVLGGHFYSRLYVALRHGGGETYGAGTRSDGDVAPASYALGTFTRADNAARAEEKLRRVLADFHEHGITEPERADAAGFLLGRRAFARQSPDQILRTWLRERALGLPAGWFDERARRAAALSLEEVNAFIRRWYDPAAFTLLRAVPADPGTEVAVRSPRRARGSAAPADAAATPASPRR